MSPILNAIILAQDSSSRMHTKLPKVLHQCAGLPMVAHAVRLAHAAGAERTVVVVDGSTHDIVESTLKPLFEGWPLDFIRGDENGNAVDATCRGLQAVDGKCENVIILHGDMPLIQLRTVNMVQRHAERAGLAILKPRMMTSKSGFADLVQPSGHGGDVGYIAWGGVKRVFEWLNGNIESDDLDSSIVSHGQLAPEVAEDLYRVDGQADLSKTCQIARDRLVRRHQESGVCFMDPQRVHLGTDVVISQDVTIGLDVTLEGNTTISADVVIDGPTFIRDSQIASNVHVHPFCHLESAQVARDANIGPYARLRHGTEIGCRVRVGNFVEIKNSSLASGAKVNHLSYIGDAEVGSETNIGAGTITCNYDGYNKHRTSIGENAFIGSNSTLVAPIRLGDGTLVAAGSTVTKSVANDALVFGRARQVEREGLAKELRSRLSQSNA